MTLTRKIVLFLALVIIVLLYTVMSDLKEDNDVPVIKDLKDFSPKTEVEINNPITITPNSNGLIDTKDWPIYENDDFGFQIKYPTGWGIEKIYSPYTKSETLFLTFSNPPEDFFVGITISNTPFEEVVESEKGGDYLISTEKFNTKGIGSVLQITKTSSYESDVIFVFHYGDNTYAMRSSPNLGRAMLATLTFIP